MSGAGGSLPFMRGLALVATLSMTGCKCSKGQAVTESPDSRVASSFVVARSTVPISSLRLQGAKIYWESGNQIFASDLAAPQRRWIIGGGSDLHDLQVDDQFVYALSFEGLMAFPLEGGEPRWLFRSRANGFYQGLAMSENALFFGSDSTQNPTIWRLDKRTGEAHRFPWVLPNYVNCLLVDHDHLYVLSYLGIDQVDLVDGSRTDFRGKTSSMAQTSQWIIADRDGAIDAVLKSDRTRIRVITRETDSAGLSAFGETIYFSIPSRAVVVSYDLISSTRTETPVGGHVGQIQAGDWGKVWVVRVNGVDEIVATPR